MRRFAPESALSTRGKSRRISRIRFMRARLPIRFPRPFQARVIGNPLPLPLQTLAPNMPYLQNHSFSKSFKSCQDATLEEKCPWSETAIEVQLDDVTTFRLSA